MLFRDNLSYIISFFLIQNPSISQKKKEMHSKQIQKLQEKFKEFEIPISNLESLITDFLPVFVEYLGDEVNAIQYKAELALSYCCQQSIPKLGLSSFLKKHFLRIVSHLTMKFHDKDVDISEKRRSMRSLSKLIQAVGGNNIGTLWPRIITILEEVNEIEALKLETLKLLSVFITTIDDKALKSLGYWVIAFLYNSFNREMKSKYKQSEPNSTISTNNIFHVGINSHNENIIDNSTQTNQNQQYIHSMLTKLIITKESLLRDKFRLIPILFRDNPLFHDINKKIEENSQKIDLDQYLSELNQKLNQPSSMERFLALKKLIQILKSKKQEIYSLIIQGESQTTIKKISDLVQSLLLGSNARGAEERLLYTKCLGLIGAIDPGVLPLRVTDSLKRHERRGKGLIFELINNYLINALQKKHDFAGFAIQELLAYLRNYHKHSMSKLSEHFGIETQELISEFHNSKYHMDMQSVTFKSKNDHSNSRQSIFQKIFSDSRDNKFHRWIGSWAFYLVSKTSEQESEIFRACQGVIKNDEAIALYLLPYLIQNIIFSQISKETNEMLDEIQDILRHANSDVFLLNRSTVEYEMVQLGLQTVFTIVDTLFEWNEARKKKSRQNRVSRKSKNSNQQNENTQNFLNSIPLEKLAYASFNFKAYARAIKYHELFTRKQMELMVAEITKKQFLAKQTPFLQKMYSAIEDPDSLDGIRTLRTSITATEKILDFETEGNWLDSMRIYDQAIQQIHEQKNQHYQQQNQQKQPHQQEQQAQTTSNTTESKLETQTDSPMANIVELNIGLLNSMSNLNLYHPLKSRIFDILNNNQFNEKDLMKFNSFGVRVGCESGDWKLAEHFLNAKCEYDFFVDLGNILLEIFHLSQKYHESLTRTRNDSTHSHLKTIPIENNTIDDNSGISDIMMSEGLNEGNETGIGANSQNDSMGLENTQSQEKLHALFGYSENSMRVVRIKELLNKARLNLMSSLSAAGMESYQRAYPYVVNLHILYEVEQMFRLWNKGFPAETHNMRKRKIFETFQQQQQNHMRKDNLVNELDKRLEICANSFRAMEPIFKTRRIVFELCQMKDEVARTWLQVARTSRKANQIDRTKSAIIHAENFHLPELYVEKAKLLFTSGNPRQALFTLEEAVNKSRAISDVSVSQLLKIQLLHNKWAADTGLKSSREVVEKYKSILVAFPRTSKAYFYLASHYDATLIARLEKYQEYLLAGNNVFTTAQKSSIRANKLSKSKSKLKVKSKAKSKTKSKKESEDLQNSLFSDPREGINLDDTLLLLKNAIRNYASSLQYSDKYIFECLPRILSLWFGLGATTTSDRSKGGDQICLLLQIFSTEKPSKQALEEWISKINKLMTKLARDLPSYKWVTAQSQLVSRICHTNPSVWVVLKDILSVVFRAYPHHSIWSMIAMHRSVVEQRKHRVAELFNSFKQYPQIDRKIQQVSQLTDLLIRVSHEKSTPLVQRYMEKMHALGELDLVVPRQDTLGLNFPGLQTENSNNSNNSKNSNNSNNSKNSNNSNNSNNFSNHNIPTIKKVCKKFEQLSSLQKPKKLKFLGSNGVHYTFLVKPHDDLRKDARMMDFMNLITRILKKNPQSRQRRLETRTYAVIPLNEKCGIIEWVENTKTFRSIVMSLYQGKNPSLQELQKIYRFQDFTNENTFTNILVPLFPPVFYRWFLLAFPDPALWFDARLTFTRSLAVMSMVGYATGLGDRHTENILLNSKTGEAVHVDFNCLFEQGSALKIPECVPFRLTHNLINAMGLSGYEGVFRRVCEITMSIFRRNQKALINVLETFVYDPLVEWTKNQQNQQENESGVRTLKRINERLQGRENAGVAWSVEGQVDLLISNATSPNNLARMFIGWMPFL
ncbi:serine/threonine-protein kinase atr [Anaeramoeba ignava]|uniref:non-specific serine/threonine protein kinase n=1 Tax=Anaeramoeba ignava TaxID=1746090 RepID=A0A9Q0RE31_ANAIG|nr:serine/threonine-protein kinase atr [Anaeramoeba ignava]